MAGIFDGVSKVSEGIKNASQLDARFATKAIRPPRMFYGTERGLRVYSRVRSISSVCAVPVVTTLYRA